MKLYESAEDYLESILRLRERQGTVRSIDVAGDLGVSKPSVSVAMRKLRESGYISVSDAGLLTLTEQGEAVAQRIFARHRLLTDFFIRLGVSPEVAALDACKVEHDLSDETFEKLCAHARREA